MVVTEKSLTLQIDGGDRTIIVNVDEEQERHDVCTVIGHGASGDSTSGNMPKIAQALAEEGHLVVRYNAGGQLPARCKLLQVMHLLFKHRNLDLGILGSKLETSFALFTVYSTAQHCLCKSCA